ncbi:uncharacterized protein [Eurosta solidaginis]|uniref:uncharacterized protein n=1 Tax=Eurosta solidaginis TaxID=178769 RepID=UPI0035316298
MSSNGTEAQMLIGYIRFNLLQFEGVCEEKGDICSFKCQIAGGSGGYCDKAKMCNCRQM